MVSDRTFKPHKLGGTRRELQQRYNMVSYQVGRTTKDDIVLIFGTPDQLTAVFTPESALELAHFLTTHANNILMDQRAAAGVQG